MGCVVVDPATGAVVCKGHNETNASKNVRKFKLSHIYFHIDAVNHVQATRHAEFVAADELLASLAAAGTLPPSPLFQGLEL